MKNNGFSLVGAIIGLGMIAGIFTLMTNLSGSSKKSEAKVMNQLNRSVLNQLIISRLAYEDICKLALNLPSTTINSLITSTSGNLAITLKDGTLVQQDAQLTKFDIFINSLTIANITKTRTAYGYSFYSGEVFISDSLTKIILKGNKKMPTQSLGPLQFLVDSTGAVVACAQTGNLQDSPIYIAAKPLP
jgi:type II secretory pathway pseudopilin PulG